MKCYIALLSLCFVFGVSGDVCSTVCRFPIPWASSSQPSCTTNMNTIENAFCPSTLTTSSNCVIGFNITGISYAGPCGCPNNCFNNTGQGICQSQACKCNTGWKGLDCSQVDCSTNECNGHGTCLSGVQNEICQCYAPRTGVDCSTIIPKLPNITETISSTQYSSYDKYGNQHPVFNASTIAQIKLFTSEETLEFLLAPENKDSSVYMQADFIFANDVTSTSMDNIGVRIKGGISRSFAKKSFKLKFNEFDDDDDHTWEQLTEIGLKGFQSDNSYLRDPMSTAVAYSVNAYIQRFGWAQLYINNQSYGLYLVTEEVGKKYLKSRFDDDSGILYKCTDNLEWLGPNPNTYANLTCDGKPCYNPKTQAASNYTKLVELLAVINLPQGEEFVAALSKIFDVDLFLRTYAFEVATGNWDGLRNANNYYLYWNPGDELWKYIRHDNDNTFGNYPSLYNVSSNDIYHWSAPDDDDGFFYDKIVTAPLFKFQFSVYLQKLFEDFYQFETLSNFRLIARAYQSLLSHPVQQDIPHYLDNGFTYDTFTNSFEETFYKPTTPLTSGQILTSFTSFMKERKSSAMKQILDYFNMYE